MEKAGYVYIVASRRNGTIYIGSTSNLPKRIWEHRNGAVSGFTRKHGCRLLVWFDVFDTIQAARHRELQMKEWQRAWKLRVIEERNPKWLDLYPTLFDGPEEPCPRGGRGSAVPALETGPRPSPGHEK